MDEEEPDEELEPVPNEFYEPKESFQRVTIFEGDDTDNIDEENVIHRYNGYNIAIPDIGDKLSLMELSEEITGEDVDDSTTIVGRYIVNDLEIIYSQPEKIEDGEKTVAETPFTMAYIAVTEREISQEENDDDEPD